MALYSEKGKEMIVMTKQEFLEQKIWYHATDLSHFNSLMNGIDSEINRGDELDFGYGFYLCPNIEWVKKYANQFSEEVIFEFHFCVADLIKKGYNFIYFGELNNEFADFVYNNRTKFMNYPAECVHDFDMVGGVMSDGRQAVDFELFRQESIDKEELYRRLLLPKEDWQLLIHSQDICDLLEPIDAYNKGGVHYDVSSYKSLHS